MKLYALYSGGYSQESPTIKFFWEALEGYTPYEKSSFLFFISGSSRPPLEGFKNFKITIDCYDHYG
jgi:ubiquitin-protein ligase E3 C